MNASRTHDQMSYMVVRYHPSKMEWLILHYSHQYEDAFRWYTFYKDRFNQVELMIEIGATKREEGKKAMNDWLLSVTQKGKKDDTKSE